VAQGLDRIQHRGARAIPPGRDAGFLEPFSTLLVDFARERGAMAIVKGLRAISDFEYELEMNQLNRRQDPEIESVYLMASAKYSFLSSSGIKELATFGGDIDDLVPSEVSSALKERLGR
jgi:pantetheine-phosphate adenylyltransferase